MRPSTPAISLCPPPSLPHELRVNRHLAGWRSAFSSMLAITLGVGILFGCRSKDTGEAARAQASASAAPEPLDRLAPGELEATDAELFGLPIPRGMTVQGKFFEFGIAAGRLAPEEVVHYVRSQVEADRVELAAARTIFPAVRIKKAPPDRIFRIEVVRDGSSTRLLVRDITPRPELKVEPVNAEAAWRRAGYTRDGKPLNLKALE